MSPSHRRPFGLARTCLQVLVGLFFAAAPVAKGIVLYDTDNALANSTAPSGQYAGSGWQWQGQYGSYLGTMIAPQYFITAQHYGLQGSSFVSTGVLNGAVDVTYTIDTAANGGQGYWDIPGTDLRILKINETFASYAPLYTGGAEVGMEMIVFGRGGPRGAEVVLSSESKGWYTTGADGVVRWGLNDISGTVSSGVGTLLTASFSAVAGQNEAMLSVGDSGGGVFVLDGGVWKLAGINYGVDGFFDTNNLPNDFQEFSAALFDKGGFYEGSDGTGWVLNPDGSSDVPSRMYASRISSSSAQIISIVGVPEPGAATLLMLSALMVFRRRRC